MNKDITHLNAVPVKTEPNQLPQLIRAIQTKTWDTIKPNLDKLFTFCDKLFFDLSNRTEDTQEQSLYFAALRAIRTQKENIIYIYKQYYDDEFLSLIHKISASDHSVVDISAKHTPPPLSPALNNTAIDAMILRATDDYHQDLYVLMTAINTIARTELIDITHNALSPNTLCSHFTQACTVLNMPNNINVIILKQFERYILNNMQPAYASALGLLSSRHLIAQGSHLIDEAQIKKPLVTQINLLQTKHNKSQLTYSFNELIHLLDRLQKLNPSKMSDMLYDHNVYTPFIKTLKATNTTHQPSLNYDVTQTFAQTSTSANNSTSKHLYRHITALITQVFSYALHDIALPTTIKRHLSDLYEPILNIALADTTLFNNENHPARELINVISSIKLSDENTTSALDKNVLTELSVIAEKLQKNHNNLAEHLQQLKTTLKHYEHHAAINERHTVQSALGRLITERAATHIDNFLKNRLSQRQLHTSIFNFLLTEWRQYLQYCFINHGEESLEWLQASQCVDDILWCATKHNDRHSISRLETLLPLLTTQIFHGLHTLDSNQHHCEEKATLIRNTLANAQTDSTCETNSYARTSQANTSNATEQQTLCANQSPTTQSNTEHLAIARNLSIGTWVAYKTAETPNTTHLKLSAIHQEQDTFLFVDYSGTLYTPKTTTALAEDLQNNCITILDDQPLFDRAILSTVKHIKKLCLDKES